MDIVEPRKHGIFQAPQSINDEAAMLVRRYDRNGDGKLSATEHTRTTFSGFPHPLDPGRTTSIERLAVLADKMGKADGVTEAWEIEGAMRLFDTGDTARDLIFELLGGHNASAHDGRLTGSERDSFEETLGPEVMEPDFDDWYIRDPHHGPVPPAAPAPAPVPPAAPAPAPMPMPDLPHHHHGGPLDAGAS